MASACNDKHNAETSHNAAGTSGSTQAAADPLTVALADGALQGDMDGNARLFLKAVSLAMNAYWAHFALSGDPNHAGAPATWPAFQPDAEDHDQRLQLDSAWQVLSDFRRIECQLWRTLFAASE